MAFILAMALNPDVQRKAQQEIDYLLEPGHLPTFEDAENFPYVTALMKEVLRWNPITPFGQFWNHFVWIRIFCASVTDESLPIFYHEFDIQVCLER